MFALALAISLALVGIASFPCWPYSARWGYRPTLAAGILLVFVALVAASGRLPRTPSGTNVAVLPSAPPGAGPPAIRNDQHHRSRKVFFLPQDLETTERETGL